jgi:hypothetical protein
MRPLRANDGSRALHLAHPPERHTMQTYILSKSKCDFIRQNFFQWSFERPADHIADQNLFKKLTHPAELHYLAKIYNWDDGASVLLWVLDSDLCTRSTANFLFWRAAPDWYLRCDINDLDSCPDYNRDGFMVIQKIVQKYKANSFSDFNIKFDPSGELESIMEKNPKWSFPPGVYDVIQGIEITLGD